MPQKAFLIFSLTAVLAAPAFTADNQTKASRKQSVKTAETTPDRLRRGTEQDPLPRTTQGHQAQDLNGDGVITRNEWPGNDRSFRAEDRNGDGVITDADRRLRPKGGKAAAVHQ